MEIEIRKLEKRDNRTNFSSGNIEIDRFLIKYAGQNQFKHKIGVTYIAVELTTQKVVGYVTASSSSLNIKGLDISEYKNLPNYPLPILRVARLGVDKEYQNRGIGKMLLKHMLYLALELEKLAGCIAVFVDAKDSAINFYKKYGFEIVQVETGELPTKPTPKLMYLSLKNIKKSL